MVRVLVLDDETPCRDSLRLLLSLEEFDVVLAANPREALHLAEIAPPDAAILDWNLCDRLNGLDVLRALRCARPGLGAVIVTGYPSRELESHIRSLDRVTYLAKPYDPAELIAATRRALIAAPPSR